jgi:hypothetical protein
MTRANEEKSDNGKPKKSELLPQGDKAREIVEVLAMMYRTIHNPEAEANDDDKSEHAN